MTTIPNFMLAGETMQNLYNQDGEYQTLAGNLFNPGDEAGYQVFATGSNAGATPIPESWNQTAVLIYTKYTDFTYDLAHENIDTGIYQWIGYDLEQIGTSGYPDDELYPIEYLQLFGQLAHFNGFRCVALPGIDLGNTASQPAKGSDTNLQWYEDNYVAMVCAQFFDALVIQAQSQQDTESDWASFVNDSVTKFTTAYNGTSQVWPNLGNQSGLVFAELSTSVGTGDQAPDMETCWTDNPVQGLYINSQNSDYADLYEFLNDLWPSGL